MLQRLSAWAASYWRRSVSNAISGTCQAPRLGSVAVPTGPWGMFPHFPEANLACARCFAVCFGQETAVCLTRGDQHNHTFACVPIQIVPNVECIAMTCRNQYITSTIATDLPRAGGALCTHSQLTDISLTDIECGVTMAPWLWAASENRWLPTCS